MPAPAGRSIGADYRRWRYKTRGATGGAVGDGYFPARGSQIELIDLVKGTATEHQRDPDAFAITTSLPDDIDEIPMLAAAGIHRLAVPVSAGAGLRAVVLSVDDVLAFRDTIERFAET